MNRRAPGNGRQLAAFGVSAKNSPLAHWNDGPSKDAQALLPISRAVGCRTLVGDDRADISPLRNDWSAAAQAAQAGARRDPGVPALKLLFRSKPPVLGPSLWTCEQ